MREIVVESKLEEELASLCGQAIVRNAEGRVLGVFSPVANPAPVDQNHRFAPGP